MNTSNETLYVYEMTGDNGSRFECTLPSGCEVSSLSAADGEAIEHFAGRVVQVLPKPLQYEIKTTRGSGVLDTGSNRSRILNIQPFSDDNLLAFREAFSFALESRMKREGTRSLPSSQVATLRSAGNERPQSSPGAYQGMTVASETCHVVSPSSQTCKVSPSSQSPGSYRMGPDTEEKDTKESLPRPEAPFSRRDPLSSVRGRFGQRASAPSSSNPASAVLPICPREKRAAQLASGEFKDRSNGTQHSLVVVPYDRAHPSKASKKIGPNR